MDFETDDDTFDFVDFVDSEDLAGDADDVFWEVSDDPSDLFAPTPVEPSFDVFADMPDWVARPVVGGPFVYWTDENGIEHGAGILVAA